MSTEHGVMEGLTLLIEQAERENKWLFCRYQGLWFSPAELRAANAAGRFRWGAPNWTLRDPKEFVDASAKRVEAALSEHANVTKRVLGAKKAPDA